MHSNEKNIYKTLYFLKFFLYNNSKVKTDKPRKISFLRQSEKGERV